jgi:hypothetical protein
MLLSMQVSKRRESFDEYEPEAAQWEMVSAIAAMYFEDARDLDVRHLWTRGDLNYFRVNWWHESAAGAARVRRSAFVVVECQATGYRIVDVTHREAA